MKYLAIASLFLCACTLLFVATNRTELTLPELACDKSKLPLEDTAPNELFAILDYNCARDYIADDASKAIALGYPSYMFKLMKHGEALSLLEASASYGEASFFLKDPQIENVLTQLEAAELLDYVRAIRASTDAFSNANDLSVALRAYMIWNDPDAAKSFSDACTIAECAARAFSCSGPMPLSMKLRVAREELSWDELYASCEPSLYWLFELRRSGLMDASCSGSIQISAIMNGKQELGEACYSGHINPSDARAWSHDRSLAYLRANQHRLFEISDMDLEDIARDFPATSSFLMNNN